MRLLTFVAAGAVVLSASLATTSARASSIIFNGQSGNAYNYGVVSGGSFYFMLGATVIFTGLADVTGASSTYSDKSFQTRLLLQA